MNANGTRFKTILGEADWGRCSSDSESLSTLWAQPPGPIEGTRWDHARQELTLAARPWTFPLPTGQRRLEQAARRGSAVDRYGNWYWIDDTETGIQVLSSGSNRASTFWPDPTVAKPVARPTSDAFGAIKAAPPPRAGRLRGLTVTDDHYLVVGTLRPGGLLVFDLRVGGPPMQTAWPASVTFAPRDLAARPTGGLFLLDAGAPGAPGSGPRVWRLDRNFMVEPLGETVPPPPATPAF